MNESYAALRALFTDAGYAFVEPPIVHPASVFVELAGEDLRRQLFLTSGADGTELALRPDYTIPVCLYHLATGAAKRRADYAYLGRVFRIRPDGPGEFLQAGVESFGGADRTAADAETLRLAFASAELLGVKKPSVRIGDSRLFAAVLDALDLSLPWRRRLERSFGDPVRLKALIAKAGTASGSEPTADKTKVRRKVEAELAASGLATVAGRAAEEIAERFVEKQVLAQGIGARAARVLGAFLDISGAPDDAIGALNALARSEKLDIAAAIGRFEKRAEAFASHDIDVSRLSFAADFGRRLDYYTGFVFEFQAGRGREPLIGGGRYDRMMALIGRSGRSAGEAVPAVGFAIWLDRIAKP